MDDFTQERNLKLSEDNLWLVYGRDDVKYKAYWAQRRLLEKKNARKRKQEEASAALKNMNVQSSAKRSPVKSRYPLTPKNDNDAVGARLPPVAKPRTDNSVDRKLSPTKRRIVKSPSNNLEEILDTGRKSQIFAKSTHNSNDVRKTANDVRKTANDVRKTANDASSESESVQERVARLQNRSTPGKEGKLARQQQGNLSRSNSSDTPTGKNERSGSISDRLAVFETSDKGRISRGAVGNAEDNKLVHERRRPCDGGHKLPGKLQKTSTMRESLEKNDVCSPLTPKLASISAVNESSDMDYQSDDNPFDVSSILRAAYENEPQEPEAVEYKKASWNVLDYLTEQSPKLDAESAGHQRESIYSNYGDDESISGFGKEIAKKRNAFKNSNQEENLKKIDAGLNERCMHKLKNEAVQSKNKYERSVDSAAHKRESTRGKHDRKDEKRKASKAPENEHANVEYSETKKKRADKPAGDVSQLANRQAPPKPPRTGKLSIEEVVLDTPIELTVENVALKDKVHEPLGESNRLERKREESRKRERAEESSYIVSGNVEESSKQSSSGKPCVSIVNEDTAITKAKQIKKQNAKPEVRKIHATTESRVDDVPNELVFSPNSQAYKSVREKQRKPATKSRKGMRRSMSFSEGQSPVVPIIHKSGYNEEASSKYNVVTNCRTPVRDEAQSTSDKIKELLEYAVSQQNIVLQASQALNLSLNGEERRGCPEIIEGERLLLLATQRRTACLDEVELLKQPDRNVSKAKEENSCSPCKAAIVISEINLPLNGDFLVALRGGRMDLGVFHFVVLIQHGPTQIYSTKVRCTYDELSRNYLSFKDKIIMKDVSHDFVLTVKVFGMHTKRAHDVIHRGKKTTQSKESPGLMKNVFSSLTPKRRVNSSDDSPVRGSSPKPVFRTTNFTAVGSATISLANWSAGKFVLNQVPKNCPLDGFLDMKIDCLPDFTASARGFLTLLEEVGGYTAWNRRWCVMQGDLISFWRFPDEENQKPPADTIDLRMCSNELVDIVPRMECSRPNTFELNVKRPLSKHDTASLLSTIEGKEIRTKHWLSADNKEDRSAWMEVLNRQLSDSKAWTTKGFKSKSMAGNCSAHDSQRKYRDGAVPV